MAWDPWIEIPGWGADSNQGAGIAIADFGAEGLGLVVFQVKHVEPGPNIGLFNGNQSSTTIQTPINICGNSLAIIGFASANCNGGAVAYNGSGGSYSGAGYGNSNGYANSNGMHHKKKHKKHKNGGANANSYANSNSYDDNDHHNNGGATAYNSGGDWNTGYNVGFGNGNQSSFTYQAPVNISCNSTALIGFASSC